MKKEIYDNDSILARPPQKIGYNIALHLTFSPPRLSLISMENIYNKIINWDLPALIKRRIKKADTPFWCAFGALFFALNLIFLYHGAHFMFGDHDWRYLKNGINLGAGLFEGRFAQFIAINLLSQGEILPIINNVLGFAGFSLGIALLAKYWQLPHNKLSYTLFALFAGITPYILSFMYFAFLIIPVLSWNMFIIGAMIISEKEQNFSLKRSLVAIILISLALGGYPPVINLIGVALCTKFLIETTVKKQTLTNLIKKYRWSILNIIISLIIYKLCLIVLTKTGAINSNYYNLQTTPISEWGNKALLVLKDIIMQFGITLPFINSGYKIIIAILCLLAIYAIIRRSFNKGLSLMFLAAVYLSAMVTLFLSTSLRETEFSPRIDFFGFMYVVSAMYAILASEKKLWLKNLGFILAIMSITAGSIALFEAEKVWHLGFISEMNLYKRVEKRFSQDEKFSPNNHYIIVQGGSPEFRSKFYHTPYNHESDDLLSISYVPAMASGVMWNYYAKKNYADETSYVYTFHADEEIKQKLREIKPWPAEGSINVGGYWILLPLNEEGLDNLRTRYLQP